MNEQTIDKIQETFADSYKDTGRTEHDVTAMLFYVLSKISAEDQ